MIITRENNFMATKKAAAKKVLVKNAAGEVIRHYSAEDHGDNFVELANEFASKVEGRVVVEA
jgi:hypothetical protein